ncbi:putative patatin-like phospholipase [Tupanvirus deep ocean]|uniref:Patatin-like phospholipase n=2 Tax=Tupanvirus TaxID=2094720 RepID=A0AC62A7H6_9VIRU|nr:putative patatin-like phospholipase [Tupanvirus deep ocean]QKU33630.1 putative patatin-like phospholipase [Tupanvirus deep ocean]
MSKIIKKKIENLGLAGGGFFGIGQVAVLKELEKYKEHFDIKRIRGVSVGSMVAALYAVGYSGDELTKILFEIDFDKLIKDTYFAYFKLYERYGMYEANKLEEEIEKYIRIKTNIKLCTFCQIDKDLTIISTNLNYQCPRFFNRENTPDMPISKAVRMSIGYPLIMTPVLYEGDLYGDGGEFLNYPITTFDDMDKTLGITFAAHNENTNGTLKNRIPINDVYDYIKSIGTTLSRATYVSQITEKYLKRSIVIHITEDINSMQFNLTNEQKKIIYECGTKAVQEQIGQILGLDNDHNATSNPITIQPSMVHHYNNITMSSSLPTILPSNIKNNNDDGKISESNNNNNNNNNNDDKISKSNNNDDKISKSNNDDKLSKSNNNGDG